MLPRAALLGPLRTREQLQAGLDDAPMGKVTIAFMNVAGANMLLAWNKVGQEVDAGTVWVWVGAWVQSECACEKVGG